MRAILRGGAAALFLCAFASIAVAQGGAANSGALDLLLPIGARGTALNGAMVAETGGEAIWWNPAGLARTTRAEFGIDHFSTFLVDGNALSLLLTAGPVGTFGLSYRLFNFGETPVTSGTGEEIGTSSLESRTLGGSFATTFGDRLAGGISFRLYQISNPCTGSCGNVVAGSSNDATVDAGIQYRSSPNGILTIGAMVANMGPKLQIHDQPQADPLPTRLHVGLSVTPSSPNGDPALRLRFSAEYVAGPSLTANQEFRLGGEVGYKSGVTTVYARGGLVTLSYESVQAGPTIGFGLQNQRVQLDVARVWEHFSTDLGKPPTYISVRVGL